MSDGFPEAKSEFRSLVNASVVEAFIDVTQDLHEIDWQFLLDFGNLASRLYIMRWKTRSVSHPSLAKGDFLPWQITWLLASHHSKHVFHGSAIPKMEKVRQSLTNLCAKVTWRFVI